MSDNAIGLLVLMCTFGASLLGMRLRPVLSQHHLSADTKDCVKLGMGLVATMAALLLGLLVAAAKSAYDTQRNEVIQIAAKIVFLDRVLANYGPESADARLLLRHMVEGAVSRMWPEERSRHSQLDPSGSALKRCTAPFRSCRRGTIYRARSNPKLWESALTSFSYAGCCLSSRARRSPRLC